MRSLSIVYLLAASAAIAPSYRFAAADVLSFSSSSLTKELCPITADTYILDTPHTTVGGCEVTSPTLLFTDQVEPPTTTTAAPANQLGGDADDNDDLSVIESLKFTNTVIRASTKIVLTPSKPFVLSFSGVKFIPPADSSWAIHLRGAYPANSTISFTRCEFHVIVTADFVEGPTPSIRTNAEMKPFSKLVITDNLFNLSSTDAETNADLRGLTMYGSSNATEIAITNNKVRCHHNSVDARCELLGMYYDGHYAARVIVKDNDCVNDGEGYAYGIYSEFDEPVPNIASATSSSSSSSSSHDNNHRDEIHRMIKKKKKSSDKKKLASAGATAAAGEEQQVPPALKAASRVLVGNPRSSTYIIEGNTFTNFWTTVFLNDAYAATVYLRKNVWKNPKCGNQMSFAFYPATPAIPFFMDFSDNVIDTGLKNQIELYIPTLVPTSSVVVARNFLRTGADLSQVASAPFLVSFFPKEPFGYLTVEKGALFSLSDNIVESTVATPVETSKFVQIGYQITNDDNSESPIVFCNNTMLKTVLNTEALYESAIVWRHNVAHVVAPNKCPSSEPKRGLRLK